MAEVPGGPGDLAGLRDKAVDQLIENGTIVSKAVEAAMRTVPRHLFISEASPEDAYNPFRAFVTKRDGEGNALSSVSDMHVMAWMLEQARIEPGMSVLEIGSGGYNAALLAEVTGPAGQVTTVDIDEQVTARTTRLLGETGYQRVRVVHGDAEHGVTGHAPHDRILATFGAWDVPPSWPAQLAPGGRLVMALRLLGLQRVIAFAKAGGHLASTASKQFGFVAAQGASAHRSRVVVLDGGVATLRFDDETGIDPGPLAGVLGTPRVEEWTGALIGAREFHDTQQMWLATVLPGFCLLQAGDTPGSGVVAVPKKPNSALAVVRGADLAYVITRPADEDGSRALEFGVHAFGPGAAGLAADVAGQVRAWAASYRHGPRPGYRVYPAGTPDAELPLPPGRSRVIDKAHSRVVISWPEAATAGPDAGTSHHPCK